MGKEMVGNMEGMVKLKIWTCFKIHRMRECHSLWLPNTDIEAKIRKSQRYWSKGFLKISCPFIKCICTSIDELGFLMSKIKC